MGKLQLFCSLLALMASSVLGRSVKDKETLHVNNTYMAHDPWGSWGTEEYCQTGNAFAFEIKYDTPSIIEQDTTAVNAVKLYCRDGSGSFTGEITSFEGMWGYWMGMITCPYLTDKITGFRLRVYPYQGTLYDDKAVDNVQIQCSSNIILDGLGNSVSQEQMTEDNHKFSVQSISEHLEVVDIPMKSRSLSDGDWTNWAYCSEGYYVSGLQSFGEEIWNPMTDNAGLMDMRLFCSNI